MSEPQLPREVRRRLAIIQPRRGAAKFTGLCEKGVTPCSYRPPRC